MTPAPARRLCQAAKIDPADLTDTDSHLTSMGWMHRDHASGSEARAMLPVGLENPQPPFMVVACLDNLHSLV
jgi:hypothetical protein